MWIGTAEFIDLNIASMDNCTAECTPAEKARWLAAGDSWEEIATERKEGGREEEKGAPLPLFSSSVTFVFIGNNHPSLLGPLIALWHAL